MKVHTRSTPLDHIQFEKGDKRLYIMAIGDRVGFGVADLLSSPKWAMGSMSFEQLYLALEAVLPASPLSTPSSDTRSPTAATGSQDSGTLYDTQCESCGQTGKWRPWGRFAALCPGCGGARP